MNGIFLQQCATHALIRPVSAFNTDDTAVVFGVVFVPLNEWHFSAAMCDTCREHGVNAGLWIVHLAQVSSMTSR